MRREIINWLIYTFSRAADLDRPAFLRWESWLAAAILTAAFFAFAAAVLATRVIVGAMHSKGVAK